MTRGVLITEHQQVRPSVYLGLTPLTAVIRHTTTHAVPNGAPGARSPFSFGAIVGGLR